MEVKRRHRNLLILACTALVAVGMVLAAWFEQQLNGEMKRQFYNNAELYTRFVADLVMPRQDAETVDQLVQNLVKDTVIYVQVVRDGRILAEHNATTVPLQVDPIERKLSFREGRSPVDAPYLDVRRALVTGPQPIDPVAYVRLGFSLSAHEHQALNKRLEIAGWTLVAVVVLMGLLIILTMAISRGGKTQPAPVQETARPSSSTQTIAPHDVLEHGLIRIDDTAKQVWFDQQLLELSPKEYELLLLLTASPGKIFSNDEIIDAIWQQDEFAVANDVRKYIYLLRQKLEANPKTPKMLITVRGFGYKLADPNGA